MNTRIGPDLREIWDEEAFDDEWACTWCGGEGYVESDDPLWDGGDIVPCSACNGTGERKHQTLF